MASGYALVFIVIAGAVALPIAVYLIFKMFGLIFKMLGNLFGFIGAEIRDAVKLVGSVIVIPIFSLLVLLNVIIGRWSASAHYGRNVGAEVKGIGASIYRLAVGNPARLLGLGEALQGVEERLPQAMADAPGRDKPKGGKAGRFEGYTIIGSLPGGGSGAKLYIAEPNVMKRAAFERRGMTEVDRVVIKSFSQQDGSTLDQIVRESRALEAAKELGLVVEHASETDRFYYVMRYVPGDSLGVITQRLHAQSPSSGLDPKHLRMAMGYIADLVDSLHTYHKGGLWHKDVKPDNIIVDRNDDRAHLVDFGLVTPMRSAMTLTTHGTEYFRDPELVRQALRGVKVNEIDGAKFDVYSAGAVMFSVIENSFPAHGGLSQLSKTCPEALRWIVRRAMADYQRRYNTAAEMRADLEVVLQASDPFTLKPVDLPSMNGQAPVEPVRPEPMPEHRPTPRVAQAPAAAASVGPMGAVAAAGQAASPKTAPRLSVTGWWSGRYTPTHGVGMPPASPLTDTPFEQAGEKAKAAWHVASTKMRKTAKEHREASKEARRGTPVPPAPRVVPPENRASAADQLKNARARVRQRRADARQRMSGRRAPARSVRQKPAMGGNKGLAFGLFLALAVFFAMIVVVGALFQGMTRSEVAIDSGSMVITGPDGRTMTLSTSPNEGLFDLSDLPRINERVLVLSDLGSPVAPEALKSIDLTLGLLNQAGARMWGDLVTSVDDADAALLEMIARVRLERGPMPLDAEGLGDQMAGLLEAIEREYDAVLWVAPNPADPEEIEFILIGPGGEITTVSDDSDAVLELADELDEIGG